MNEFSPTGSFDANTVAPEQGGTKHPVGLFPFQISNTAVVMSKDEKSTMFKVTFDTPAGSIDKHYNLKHENPQTVEIAQKQLSALCHATGVFKLNWANQGRELVGARGSLNVDWQKNQEPGSEKGGPTGGYVEVKKVMDIAGNEPGKAPAAQAQPQTFAPQQQPQQTAPMQQQPAGGWNAPQTAAQPQQAQQPVQQGNATGPAWGAPQGQAAPPPPWGQK